MTDASGPTRDLGAQPIAELMDTRGITVRDVVQASTEQITHKMVQRARKGRRLSPRVMGKVHRAMNAAAGEQFAVGQLFNYAE